MSMCSKGTDTSATSAGATYWRRVLLAGGFTAVPRWSSSGIEGVEQQVTRIPRDLGSALHRQAQQWSVTTQAVLLAAHVAVLIALTNQRAITTGLVVGAEGPPLPCGLDTEAVSWLELVRQAEEAMASLRRHRNVPVEPLRRELGLTEPLFETVLDAHRILEVSAENPAEDGFEATALTMGEDTVLWITVLGAGDQLTFHASHRTEVLDAEAAKRIVGYHFAALTQLVADPHADYRRARLLSDAERHLQLEGFAGRNRELPDCRAHELFEAQARAHPDTVAAVCGQQRLSYGELNARANRLARTLLAREVRPEGVVAVVTERSLDWLVAVLAVFKAGGVYLPIEPHFPPDRIVRTMTKAGCRLVLTEPGVVPGDVTAALASLPEVTSVSIDLDEAHFDGDLGLDISADQLAYIYFTSGSTGEPKGAMCEHAGMLNHLLAKIDDLEIDADSVVAQTAPQCFDISLWQLISALLVGGQTVLIEQDRILDVARFVQRLVRMRVSVLQLVPSYLEVVLSYLDEDHWELPDLRYVSATGEALKQELAERWFAAYPHIKLLNAYGLTETSDDTNHEVLDCAPTGRVPLGAPIHNIRVYVVDDQLEPVPLGVAGLIVFSGICVGRGYVNDPERTRAAYLDDPHDRGQRLYLSGDYGRWLPGGRLEFLGRRDSQVKLNGFRIELGEIEETLARVPGVRAAAVIITDHDDRARQLVGFYATDQVLPGAALRARLASTLPTYMVPAHLVQLAHLPLTANGKIDRTALRQQATMLASGETTANAEVPHTPGETRLARAWATVLDTPFEQIGRHDHFFDRGGTSLSAVRLAIALDRLLSVREITGHPVLADQARLLDLAIRPDGRS